MVKYSVVFEKTSSGYSVYVPDLQSVAASGATKEIAEQNIFEAISFYLEGLREENLEIPISVTESEMMVLSI